MPTSLDSRMTLTARRLIDRYGMNATLEWPTAFSIDPDTRQPVGGASTSSLGVKVTPPFPLNVRDRALSPGYTSSCYLAALGLTHVPVLGDTLVLNGGLRLRVMMVSPVYSGDLVAAYELGLSA